MKEQLEKIDQKIDKLDERLDKVDTHLAVYNEQLKYHIKRTDILEKDVKPIKEHVQKVAGVLKFISISLAILGTLATIQAIR